MGTRQSAKKKMDTAKAAYPFAAIVGQDSLREALMLCVVDPSLGGVLALGDRGTGKTTAVRGLASLLPPVQVVKGCRYRCDPLDTSPCELCDAKDDLEAETAPVSVVDLPLGATEDRVLGALDIERALVSGEKVYEPGLLADANRGFLYIDEVNLLEDHLVDVLLDVAASGWNVVEREGLSLKHPAKFVLVGSGNPEEGELRPQLLDRFGLAVDVRTPDTAKQRVEIIRRREAYEADRGAFFKKWQRETTKLRNRLLNAQARLPDVIADDAALTLIAEICIALGTDGLRGELTLIKAARARAALDGSERVDDSHIRAMAPLALAHRLRRNPLDDARSTVRVERVLDDIFAKREAA
ncbi:MAG: magnesium chelatase ATPase subunit I [Pseudomonadota bacterium]